MTYQEFIDYLIDENKELTSRPGLERFNMEQMFTSFYDIEKFKDFINNAPLISKVSNTYRMIRDDIIVRFYRRVDQTSIEFHEIDKLMNNIYPMVCPEKGEFIGYKKVCVTISSGSHYSAIATLYIPEDAKRSSAFGKKCRCSKAEVLSICVDPPIYTEQKTFSEAYSYYDSSFIYRVGETVEVNNFDDCRWRECSTGIHFFKDAYDAAVYCP